jgi:hypothetical protein
VIKCKLLSASQPFGWSKINMIRRRKKAVNKDRMKEGKEEIFCVIKMKVNMLIIAKLVK